MIQKTEIPENWAVYIGRVEDKPAVFRVNLGIGETDSPIEGYTQCVRLNLVLKAPNEYGFTTDEERERLYNIEDIIISSLKETDFLAGVVTYQGNTTWFYYTQEAPLLAVNIEKAFTNITDYEPEIRIVDDPNWEIYSDYLYPNIYEHQSIKNSAVRRHCEQSGDHTDQERPIDHWLYFNTEKDMAEAIDKMKALGYEIQESRKIEPEEGDDPNEDLGYQLIITKVNTVEAIDPDTWDLIDVALDTNGQYDGWETILVK